MSWGTTSSPVLTQSIQQLSWGYEVTLFSSVLTESMQMENFTIIYLVDNVISVHLATNTQKDSGTTIGVPNVEEIK